MYNLSPQHRKQDVVPKLQCCGDDWGSSALLPTEVTEVDDRKRWNLSTISEGCLIECVEATLCMVSHQVLLGRADPRICSPQQNLVRNHTQS